MLRALAALPLLLLCVSCNSRVGTSSYSVDDARSRGILVAEYAIANDAELGHYTPLEVWIEDKRKLVVRLKGPHVDTEPRVNIHGLTPPPVGDEHPQYSKGYTHSSQRVVAEFNAVGENSSSEDSQGHKTPSLPESVNPQQPGLKSKSIREEHNESVVRITDPRLLKIQSLWPELSEDCRNAIAALVTASTSRDR